MLDETDWAEVAPFLDRHIQAIQAYRQQHQVGLAEARDRVSDLACAAYERLTGFRETNPHAICHHRLSIHGPPCGQCGRPLRTPEASFCVCCGWRPKPSSPARLP